MAVRQLKLDTTQPLQQGPTSGGGGIIGSIKSPIGFFSASPKPQPHSVATTSPIKEHSPFSFPERDG